MQSAAAKLSTKFASRGSFSAITSLESWIVVEPSDDLKFYEDLVKPLNAAEPQDHTFLGNLRSVGRRVFGQFNSLRFSTCPA